MMDDLRTKYRRARQAKNQANCRARKERELAERARQNSQARVKETADAKAQALTAELEARASRRAAEAKDTRIERQRLLIAELERQVGILRDQLRTALYRDHPPMTQHHACECARQAREATERAMARIEPHARPWWRRVFEWPKSDGGR